MSLVSSLPKPISLRLISLLCITTFCLPARAESNSVEQREDRQLGLGVAVVSTQAVYRGIGRDENILPVVSYENATISIATPRADFKIAETGHLSFRVRARFARDGYHGNDSWSLAGMATRDPSLWGGGAVVWNLETVRLSAEVLRDLLAKSKGVRTCLQFDRRFQAGLFGMTPRLGAEWVNAKFVDYYFGVSLSEATASRPYYHPKSGNSFNVGLRIDYSPSRHHTLFLDVEAVRSGNSIKDSPIVGSGIQRSVGLGYLYGF